MKTNRRLPLVAAAMMAIATINAQAPLPDSTDFLLYDQVGMVFDSSSRTIYTRDNDDNILLLVNKNYVTGNYENSYKSSRTYDPNHNITENIGQLWNVSQWENNTKTNYTYSNNLITEEIGQNWNTNQWVNNTRTTYNYDGSARILETVNYSWNSGTSQWDQFGGMQYEYNVQNNLVVARRIKNWNGSQYVYISMDSTVYNGNSVTETIYHQYQLGNWVNAYRDINITWYDEPAGKRATSTAQMWIINAWVNTSETLSYYDLQGRDTAFVTQSWDPLNSVFVNSALQTSTYYPSDDKEYQKYYAWINSAWDQTSGSYNIRTFGTLGQQLINYNTQYNALTADYDSASKTIYYYPVGLSVNPVQQTTVSLFPNPAESFTNLVFNSKSSENVLIEIIALDGRVVQSQITPVQQGTNQVVMPLEHLSPGTYILRMSGKEISATQKILKK